MIVAMQSHRNHLGNEFLPNDVVVAFVGDRLSICVKCVEGHICKTYSDID